MFNRIQRFELDEEDSFLYPEEFFGREYVNRVKPYILQVASRLTDDTLPAFWESWKLSSDGFFLCPQVESVEFQSVNGHCGTMSGDAFGLVVCLFAFKWLYLETRRKYASYKRVPRFGLICCFLYDRVKEYAFEHPESQTIFYAIEP